MNSAVQRLTDEFRELGLAIRKFSRGEIYQIDSKIIWFDYSRERPGKPGTFFHGTSQRVFEEIYGGQPDSFFFIFLLGFPSNTEAIVVSANRFHEMFRSKNTDSKGQWKYTIQHERGKYLVKVWGVGDFDITDGLHNYQFLGLSHNQSQVLRRQLASTVVQAETTPQVSTLMPAAQVSMAPVVDSHEAAQGVLLTVGRLLGFETYTPDQAKQWNGRRLGEIASLTSLPQFTYSHLLNFVRLIDVIWFSYGFPSHCFEIEHTTNVRDGLLRQYQIAQATNARFFIIGPESQRNKFRTEVAGEPFRAIANRYLFRSYEELVDFFHQAQEYSRAKEGFGI